VTTVAIPSLKHIILSRAKPLSIVICAAIGCLIAAGAARGETLKGTVRYAGAPQEKKRLPVTIDQYICGKDKEAEELVLSPANGIRNAVVSLQNPPPGAKWDANFPSVKMDQKQCAFVPRVSSCRSAGPWTF
jgi:hypothetical protein